MTQRKGEITLPEIKRRWPHHVALSADKVRGLRNSEIVWSLAKTLSAGPRPNSLRPEDNEFAVFCFAKPEDAEVFCKQFSGERLSGDDRMSAAQTFRELTETMRPQDPHGDGTGLRFETGEHGGDYPDNMPQAITVTDAQGRWAVFVPLRVGGKIVVPDPPARCG